MKKLDEDILTALEKLFQANRAILWNIGKEKKLSPLQVDIIDYLQKTKREFCTVSHLAHELDLKKPTISDSVQTLLKKGYLKKIKDDNDKRIVYLELTQPCRDEFSSILEHKFSFMQTLESVPTADKEAALRTLVKLINTFFENSLIQAARICYSCANFKKNADPASESPHFCVLRNSYFNDDQVTFNCNVYAEK